MDDEAQQAGEREQMAEITLSIQRRYASSPGVLSLVAWPAAARSADEISATRLPLLGDLQRRWSPGPAATETAQPLVFARRIASPDADENTIDTGPGDAVQRSAAKITLPASVETTAAGRTIKLINEAQAPVSISPARIERGVLLSDAAGEIASNSEQAINAASSRQPAGSPTIAQPLARSAQPLTDAAPMVGGALPTVPITIRGNRMTASHERSSGQDSDLAFPAAITSTSASHVSLELPPTASDTPQQEDRAHEVAHLVTSSAAAPRPAEEMPAPVVMPALRISRRSLPPQLSTQQAPETATEPSLPSEMLPIIQRLPAARLSTQAREHQNPPTAPAPPLLPALPMPELPRTFQRAPAAKRSFAAQQEAPEISRAEVPRTLQIDAVQGVGASTISETSAMQRIAWRDQRPAVSEVAIVVAEQNKGSQVYAEGATEKPISAIPFMNPSQAPSGLGGETPAAILQAGTGSTGAILARPEPATARRGPTAPPLVRGGAAGALAFSSLTSLTINRAHSTPGATRAQAVSDGMPAGFTAPGNETIETWTPSAPSASEAPPWQPPSSPSREVDVARVADQVYAMLVRRLSAERERRGR